MKHFFKVADIEDIARSKIVPKIQGAPGATNQISLGTQAQKKKVEAEPELKIEDCPLPEEDFGNWLKF